MWLAEALAGSRHSVCKFCFLKIANIATALLLLLGHPFAYWKSSSKVITKPKALAACCLFCAFVCLFLSGILIRHLAGSHFVFRESLQDRQLLLLWHQQAINRKGHSKMLQAANIEYVCDCGIITGKKKHKNLREGLITTGIHVYLKENIKLEELICEANNAKYLPSNGFPTDNKRFDVLFWTARPSPCLTLFKRIRFLIAGLLAIILFLLASRSR